MGRFPLTNGKPWSTCGLAAGIGRRRIWRAPCPRKGRDSLAGSLRAIVRLRQHRHLQEKRHFCDSDRLLSNLLEVIVWQTQPGCQNQQSIGILGVCSFQLVLREVVADCRFDRAIR